MAYNEHAYIPRHGQPTVVDSFSGVPAPEYREVHRSGQYYDPTMEPTGLFENAQREHNTDHHWDERLKHI